MTKFRTFAHVVKIVAVSRSAYIVECITGYPSEAPCGYWSWFTGAHPIMCRKITAAASLGKISGTWPYLIFVTSTTSGARGEKICHVEKFLHMTYCHLERFSTWQIDMWKKFSIWEMWRKSVKWRNRLSYGEISPHEKYAYYAVLLQNLLILRFTLFCHDLRAFAWRN